MRLALVVDCAGNDSTDVRPEAGRGGRTRRFMLVGAETSPNQSTRTRPGNDRVPGLRANVAQTEKFVFPGGGAEGDYFEVRERAGLSCL